MSENPYLNAKKVHNEFQSRLVTARFMWQLTAILALLIALSSVAGMVYIGQQSKFVPYVVAVDKLGQTYAVERADRAAPVDMRVMQASVARFIALARMVTPDATLQKKAVFDLYAMLSPSDPATHKMNEFFEDSENNPFLRATTVTVSTEIGSVIQQSEESWQVDWVEELRDRDGTLVSRVQMRSLLRVYVVSPTTKTSEEQIRKNPLGIFIRDFNWSKQL